MTPQPEVVAKNFFAPCKNSPKPLPTKEFPGVNF